jgi:formylglycine-generating enzyme required for sulfatase activity
MKPVKLLLLIITFGSLAVPSAAIALTPAQFSLRRDIGVCLAGATGTVYAIQATTNLARTDSWRCISLLALPSTPYTVPGTTPSAAGCRFYRAVAMSRTNMVFIPAGTFLMGSPSNDVDAFSDEFPQTTVKNSRSFWMSRTLVTQQEYQSVLGNNPSVFTNNTSLPVEMVTWFDATNYCAQLTRRDLVSGQIPAGLAYRLPTEAEWEYACRAGTTTRYYYGDDPNYTNLASHAWYEGNSGYHTQPVAQKTPNPWGLYDMCGNVWEWCQDWYAAYPGGSVPDPQGPATGDYRVLRGGSWDDPAWNARSACRYGEQPQNRREYYGFRVVLAPANP